MGLDGISAFLRRGSQTTALCFHHGRLQGGGLCKKAPPQESIQSPDLDLDLLSLWDCEKKHLWFEPLGLGHFLQQPRLPTKGTLPSEKGSLVDLFTE